MFKNTAHNHIGLVCAHTHNLQTWVNVDIEVADRLEQKAKEKGITVSILLEQLLNERKEKDVTLHRRDFKVEKLREYDFKFRESAFKAHSTQ